MISIRFYKILQAYPSISEPWFCEVNSLPEQFLNWTTLSSLQNVFDQVRVVPSLCPRSWIESCWKASWQTHVGETWWSHSIQSDSTWFLENAPIFVALSSFDCGTDGTGQLRLLLGRHKCCGAHGTCRDLPITTAELFSSGAARDCWDLLGFYSTSHGSFNTWESWVDKFLFWNSSRSAGSSLAHSFPFSLQSFPCGLELFQFDVAHWHFLQSPWDGMSATEKHIQVIDTSCHIVSRVESLNSMVVSVLWHFCSSFLYLYIIYIYNIFIYIYYIIYIYNICIFLWCVFLVSAVFRSWWTACQIPMPAGAPVDVQGPRWNWRWTTLPDDVLHRVAKGHICRHIWVDIIRYD
jgi:hypothetical protein